MRPDPTKVHVLRSRRSQQSPHSGSGELFRIHLRNYLPSCHQIERLFFQLICRPVRPVTCGSPAVMMKGLASPQAHYRWSRFCLAVHFGIGQKAREVVVEGSVDDAVRQRYRPTKAFAILQVTAMDLCPGGDKGFGGSRRPGEADHLMAGSDQLGNECRADKTRRAGYECAHVQSPRRYAVTMQPGRSRPKMFPSDHPGRSAPIRWRAERPVPGFVHRRNCSGRCRYGRGRRC